MSLLYELFVDTTMKVIMLFLRVVADLICAIGDIAVLVSLLHMNQRMIIAA